MNILISSGFLETELSSFRENQYTRLLAEKGHDVTIHTSTESCIWKRNRAKLPLSNPSKYDSRLEDLGVKVIRKKPYIRFSDFLILPLPIDLIKSADVIHIIEFRQGNSVLIAMIAKFFGKPVIYDHEQRGDRHYSFLHSMDSFARRILIGIGSLFIDKVRHTVHANRDHFLKNRWSSKASLKLSPLGADERYFSYSSEIRNEMRSKYGIVDIQKVAALTGKLDDVKHSIDALKAAIDCGYIVVVAGSIANSIAKEFEKINISGKVIYLGKIPADELRDIYCMVDLAIFTTFSISYWEALATGATILVPKTTFSEQISDELKIHTFGSPEMFDVPEEQYRKDSNVYEYVKKTLNSMSGLSIAHNRVTRNDYLWPAKIDELIADYDELARKR